MNKLSKILGIGALSGAALYGVNQYAPEIGQTIGTTAGVVDGIIRPLGETLTNLVEQVPVVGEAAPFAFPMVAGGSLGYKLADVINIENKILKHGFGLVGAGTGAALSKSVLAPYLALYGMYKTGKFVYDKKVVQNLFKTVATPIVGTYGALKGGFSGTVSGTKEAARKLWA